MIIPLLDAEHVLLERQFRYPLGRSIVEFPAGKIDPGEPPFECARRELFEETGYTARRWSYLGGLHNAIAYSDEKIEIYLAEDLERTGDATLDAGETLEVFEAPWRQLLEWVRDGSRDRREDDGRRVLAREDAARRVAAPAGLRGRALNRRPAGAGSRAARGATCSCSSARRRLRA